MRKWKRWRRTDNGSIYTATKYMCDSLLGFLEFWYGFWLRAYKKLALDGKENDCAGDTQDNISATQLRCGLTWQKWCLEFFA
jgi:hypothetical protein